MPQVPTFRSSRNAAGSAKFVSQVWSEQRRENDVADAQWYYIATWLRGRENTTIPLFDPQTDPDWTEDYRNKHNGTLPPAIDCSKSEACVASFPRASATLKSVDICVYAVSRRFMKWLKPGLLDEPSCGFDSTMATLRRPTTNITYLLL